MLIASVLESSALETSRRDICRDKSSGIGTLLVIVQSTLATPPQERGIDSRTCTVTCTVTDPGVSIYTPSYTVHSAVAKKKKARQKTCQKKKKRQAREHKLMCVSSPSSQHLGITQLVASVRHDTDTMHLKDA